MKISPLTQGSGVPSAEVGAVSTQRTSPDRIAAAKAIASGQQPQSLEQTDPQVARMQANVRKIKMRTQVSPDRELTAEELASLQPTETASQATTESAISDSTEQTQTATDETKPLSPQFAALAKQRRALQQERAAFEQEKAKLANAPKEGREELLGQIKLNPLRVLEEAGVSYEQLTEAILSGQSNPEIAELKAKIAALEQGIDTKLTDRDSQAEKQVLAEMRREADRLVAEGETYEMVRTTGSVPEVIELIHRTYKETGEVLDVTEALELVENDLLENTVKFASLGKVKSRLTPAQQESQEQQQQSRDSGMRTLTNRDGARPNLGRRARAMAAFNGQLKR